MVLCINGQNHANQCYSIVGGTISYYHSVTEDHEDINILFTDWRNLCCCWHRHTPWHNGITMCLGKRLTDCKNTNVINGDSVWWKTWAVVMVVAESYLHLVHWPTMSRYPRETEHRGVDHITVVCQYTQLYTRCKHCELNSIEEKQQQQPTMFHLDVRGKVCRRSFDDSEHTSLPDPDTIQTVLDCLFWSLIVLSEVVYIVVIWPTSKWFLFKVVAIIWHIHSPWLIVHSQ